MDSLGFVDRSAEHVLGWGRVTTGVWPLRVGGEAGAVRRYAVPGVTSRFTCPYGDEIAVDGGRSRESLLGRTVSCKASHPRAPRLELRGCSDDRRSLPVIDIDLAIFEKLLQGIGAVLKAVGRLGSVNRNYLEEVDVGQRI